MTAALDIIQAIADPNILGDTLSILQRAGLKALYGLPMTDEEAEIALRHTGATWAPGQQYREAAFVCGRRSGKSDKIASNVALYEAFFGEHPLSPGETGVVLLLAQNMRQAKVVKGYIEGKIDKSPLLARHVVASTAHEIVLDNRITIAIHPSSFRSIRGLSVVCCICDEIAFWWTEEGYANPDAEVIRAVRPAMATFPNPKLLLVSSPYTRSGVLWDLWQKRDSDMDALVWHATSAEMNPTLRRSFLEKEQRSDPENYRREYLAEFTDAVSSFLPAEAIQRCVVPGRTHLGPDRERFYYVASIDAAYKGDCFTLCIAHYDRSIDKTVVDRLCGWQGTRERPLRLGDVVLPEIKELSRQYGFREIWGDQFGAEPLREIFEHAGFVYEEHTFTNQSKADLYATLRTGILEQRLELLDHEPSLKELRSLELQSLPAGGTRIGHAGHGRVHDDYADAIALAVSKARGHVYDSPVALSAGDLESVRMASDPAMYSPRIHSSTGLF